MADMRQTLIGAGGLRNPAQSARPGCSGQHQPALQYRAKGQVLDDGCDAHLTANKRRVALMIGCEGCGAPVQPATRRQHSARECQSDSVAGERWDDGGLITQPEQTLRIVLP